MACSCCSILFNSLSKLYSMKRPSNSCSSVFSRWTILLKQLWSRYLLWVMTSKMPLWALISFLRALRFSKSKNTSGSSIIITLGLLSISLMTCMSLNSPPLSSEIFWSLCLIKLARLSFLWMLLSKLSPSMASKASKSCWYFSSKGSISVAVSIAVQTVAISCWRWRKGSAI